MSTPTRELPPLNVRIQGDVKSFAKAIAGAQVLALNFQKQVNRMVFSPSIAPIRKAVKISTKAAIWAITQNVQDVGRQIGKIQTNNRIPANARKAMRQTILALVTGAVTAVNAISGQLGGSTGFARYARAQLRQAVRTAIQGVSRATTAAILAGVNGINAAALTRTFQRQLNNALNRSLGRLANGIGRGAQGGGTGGGGRAGGGGGGGMGAGMGNRADIYMHAQGIKNLVSMVSGVVKMSTAWQDMTIQLEGFTGSAKEAEATMNKIQSLALVSPYGMQTLGDATRTMMSYGMEVKQSLQVTEMLGDLSGGSAERMHRLAYAMGQIASVGHLTGMELRQLTEAGFNPLQTMAKAMATDKSVEGIAKQFAILNDMKSKGRITSDMVIAAMKVETSAGGRFAGQMQRLSQTVSGLSQQIREYAQLIGRRFMDTLIKDTETALKVILHYVKGIEQWVTANQAAVREIALVAVQVVGAIAAFHGLGFVIALLRWNMRSLGIIAQFLRGMLVVLAPVTWAYNALLWAWNAAVLAIGFSYQLLTTYIAACNAMAAMAGGPIALIVGAIVALSAGWAAMIVGPFILGAIALAAWNGANAIWQMGANFETTWASMENFASNAQGFFENFGHNSKVIAKYVVDNWRAMATDMQNILTASMNQIPHNMAVMWNTGKRLAMQFLVWMTNNMYIGFRNMFTEILKEFGTFATNAFKILLKVAMAIVNPQSLIGEGLSMATSAVAAVIDPLEMGRDTAKQMDDGLWEAMKMIMREESQNLKSGMENVVLQTPALEGLKLDKKDWSKLPKAEPGEIPPAYNPDFQAMLGKETGKGGNKGAPATAPMYQSGEHAKQIYAHSQMMQARAAGTPKKEDKQAEANKLLKAIERNTKPSQTMQFIVPTDLAGVP